jgi:Imidazolonepropionase and related amidohydrolases
VVDDIVDVDHVENLGGGLVTPGLIDAHTHPVYAGNRWAELAMRSNGSSPPRSPPRAAASRPPSP